MQQSPITSRAKSAIDRLLSLGVAQPDELHPCSVEDILTLEHARHVTLPAAYKLFLSRMGRGAGQFLTADHWTAFYDDLLNMNSMERGVLIDATLPSELFCFATRMGDVYLFFAADGSSDDPPVYYWNDASGSRVDIAFASFWDWFDEMVSDHAKYAP